MDGENVTKDRGDLNMAGATTESGRVWLPSLMVCELVENGKVTSKIPAVKVRLEEGRWCVFPLSMPEYGRVWVTEREMTPWKMREYSGTWEEAPQEFAEWVSCYSGFMEAILDALKLGCYEDGEEVTAEKWPKRGLYDSTKISIKLRCGGCGARHTVSPRLMFVVPASEKAFRCEFAGSVCYKKKGKNEVSTRNKEKEDSEEESISSESSESESDDQKKRREVRGQKVRKEKSKRKQRRDSWVGCSTRFPTMKNNSSSSEDEDRVMPKGMAWESLSRIRSPEQYTVGRPVSKLETEGPADREVLEYQRIRRGSKWSKWLTALSKWKKQTYGGEFEGNESASDFNEWLEAMLSFFEAWSIENSAVQGMLATTTFSKNARNWWRAHLAQRPEVIMSFPQIAELIKRELVPKALPTASYRAWMSLKYRGDIEDYLQQVTDLIEQYPLDSKMSHSLAAMPLGDHVADQIEAFDERAGKGGMTFPAFKKQLRILLKEREAWRKLQTQPAHRDVRRFQPRGSWQQSRRAAAQEEVGRQVAIERRESGGVGVRSQRQGIADRFCLVCGHPRHSWVWCWYKKSKGCACCGKDDHWVKDCGQRWREPRVNFREEGSRENSNNQPRNFSKNVATSPNNTPLGGRTAQCKVFNSDEVPVEDVAGQEFGRKLAERGIEGMEMAKECCEEAVIAPESGITPVRDPTVARQLEYEIVLDGRKTVALLDHGCTSSFIDEEWVADEQFPVQELEKPCQLYEFTKKGPMLTKSVKVAEVEFVGLKKPWRFIVIANAPQTVVVGLDMIRRWSLCYNPLNDRLLSLTSCDARVVRAAFSAPKMLYDEGMVGGRIEKLGEIVEEVRICWSVEVGRVAARRKEKWEAIWEEEQMEMEAIRTMSVTGGSEEEVTNNGEALKELPEEVRKVVEQFPRLFSPPTRVPPDREVVHEIRLKEGAVPVRKPAYPLGEAKLQAMREQVQELAQKGWIEPSSSPWASPILFVKKKEGEWRLVVDYRGLNAVTIDDSFPLPRVEILLHRAGSSSTFSKLDLTSGFHQIALNIASRPLTAFRLPEPVEGCTLWQWTVMPFGLKNAPPTFQRAMTKTLQGCEDVSVVYIDDILVYEGGKANHLAALSQVCAALQKDGFHARVSKCEFAKDSVGFLGHRLTQEGLEAAAEKVAVLQAWQPPLKNAKEVKQFLGLVMWYKSFIPHLATIASPLFSLTSSRAKFAWNDAATEAVKTLQSLVAQAPCLARWERGRKTRVITDASRVGLGAVLEQWHEGGWRPIAFWSRKLKDAETRYSTTEREWLAVVEAVAKRWRGFLEDSAFVVCSDHAALQQKLCKSSHEPPVNDRQCRWIESLMPFSLEFQYIKGERNVVADALSRCPLVARTVTLIRSFWTGMLNAMKVVASQDTEYQRLIEEVMSEDKQAWIDGGLLRVGQNVWWVPRSNEIRTALLAEAHDSPVAGHFGVEKTLATLSAHWRWKGMRADVEQYVRSCVRCQKVKSSTQKTPGLLHPIMAQVPGEILTMDFVSKFAVARRTKHEQCLVFIDKFSRFTMFEGCGMSVDAKETARIFMKRVLPLFGVPRVVLSDRGPQFTAAVWKEVLGCLGSKVALASTHHPQTDGQSERAIQTLLRLIRTFAAQSQDRWEEFLPLFEVAVNNVPHASIKIEPAVVALGRKLRLPSDFISVEEEPPPSVCEDRYLSKYVADQRECWQKVWQLVVKEQEDAAYKMKRRYDVRRKEMVLTPGDLVLLSVKSHTALGGLRKHRDRYVGPYIIWKKIHANAYQLRGLPPGVPLVQNVCFLKLFCPSPVKFASRPSPGYAQPLDIEGHVEWEVEQIVGHRMLRHGFRYCVQWKDSPQRQWLREYQMSNCKKMVDEYHREKGLPPLDWSSFEQETEDSEDDSRKIEEVQVDAEKK